jgi:hypothetical protein
MCCRDTGKPVDPTCGPHRGYLIPGGDGHSEPTTPTIGLTIHPRVKRQVAHGYTVLMLYSYCTHTEHMLTL